MDARCDKDQFGRLHRLLSLGLIATLIATVASAQPPVTSLSGCGKISKSGVYNLDTSAINAPAGDCITIATSNVVLNLDGATITGSGSGAGIRVTAKMSNIFIEGRAATISGFGDGIEIDGSKVTVENVGVASDTDAGILLKGATQAALSNLTATNNTHDGIRVEKGSYNIIGGALSITDNGRYGIWLMSTSNNNVGGFFIEDNAMAGIYLGCSSDGPGSAACKTNAVSKSNSIFNGRAQASSPGAQTYGILIDLGNDSNRVTNVSSPSPYEKLDLDDENPSCAHNAWFGHGLIFSSSPADCIH